MRIPKKVWIPVVVVAALVGAYAIAGFWWAPRYIRAEFTRFVAQDLKKAPRLGEVELTPERALEWHAFMIRQVVRMLCAGLIHGDLSEFNVLVDADGPVIIDLPQAVDAAANNNAFRLLERDVNNLRETFGRAAPELLETHYAHEIWALFEAGELTPDSGLTGRFVFDETAADVDGVLTHIENERFEAEEKQRRIAEAAQ